LQNQVLNTLYDTPYHLPDTIGVGSYEKYFGKIEYLKQNYDVYMLAVI